MTKVEAIGMAVGIGLIPLGVGIALGARFSRSLVAQWRSRWWVRGLAITLIWMGPVIANLGHTSASARTRPSHTIAGIIADMVGVLTGSAVATALLLRRRDIPAAQRRLSPLGWAAMIAVACGMVLATMLPTRDMNIVIMPHVYVWALVALVVSLTYGLLGAIMIVERDREGRFLKPATSRIVGWSLVTIAAMLAAAAVWWDLVP